MPGPLALSNYPSPFSVPTFDPLSDLCVLCGLLFRLIKVRGVVVPIVCYFRSLGEVNKFYVLFIGGVSYILSCAEKSWDCFLDLVLSFEIYGSVPLSLAAIFLDLWVLSRFSSTSLIFLNLSFDLVCSEDLRDGEVESTSALSLCTFYCIYFSNLLIFLSAFFNSASFSKINSTTHPTIGT